MSWTGRNEVPWFIQPRAEEAEERPHGGCSSSQGVNVTATGPEGMAWGCIRGGSVWGLGKGSSPEGGGHGTGCPGQWAQSHAAGVQGAFGQGSQTYGLDFGWWCV